MLLNIRAYRRLMLAVVSGIVLSCMMLPRVAANTAYQLETLTIQSKALQESRTITVQLPKSYTAKPTQRYPVIYRLDGQENLPLMNAVLEQLQQAGAAPEVIIVAIENVDRLRDFYPTVNQEPAGPLGVGGGAAKFLSFIKTELRPLIEQRYRSHDFRLIEGASAGGVFVLYALEAAPGLFQAHIAYSPAVWWDHGAQAKSSKAFFAKQKKLPSYLYLNIGAESGVMRSRYDDMRDFIRLQQPAGFSLVNEAYANVPHGLTTAAGIFSAYHQLFLPLQMPLSAYKGSPESVSGYYQRLSAQYGEQIKPPEPVVRELAYQLVNAGELSQAIALFQYGISLYPATPDAYNGLAYGYEQNKQYQQALEQVNRALALAKPGYDGYQVYVARKARLLQLLGQ